MTSNSQSSGTQSLWPPIVGSAGPQNFGLPMYMQFRPVGSQQHGQPFTLPGSQQYLPVGQGMPAQNVGPSPQNQQLPFIYPSFIGHGPQPLSNHMHGVGGSGQFAPSTYGQPENYINASSRYQPISRMHTAATNVQPFIQLSLDWQEHTSCDGRRYYYNKMTKQSSWEKPVELMTPVERADASTDWKEFTSSNGRKYYYNKVTKQSIWIIPEELKLTREQAKREASHEIQSESDVVSQSQVSFTIPLPEASAVPSSAPSGRTTRHVPVTPIVAARSQPAVAASRSPSLPALFSGLSINAAGIQSPVAAVATLSHSISGNGGLPAATTPAMSTSDIASSLNGGVSVQDVEEARKGMTKLNIIPSEEKAVEEETLVYTQEGKIAYKETVGSPNMESDWNWELV